MATIAPTRHGSSSRHVDALKRLSQMYGTRENEVDDLLRNRKLVCLYDADPTQLVL